MNIYELIFIKILKRRKGIWWCIQHNIDVFKNSCTIQTNNINLRFHMGIESYKQFDLAIKNLIKNDKKND